MNFQLECNHTGPTPEPVSTRTRTSPPTGTRCLPVLAPPLVLHPNIRDFIVGPGNGDHVTKSESQFPFMWLERKKEKPLIMRFLIARGFQRCRSQLTAVQQRDTSLLCFLNELCIQHYQSIDSKLFVGKGMTDTAWETNVNACSAQACFRSRSEGL